MEFILQLALILLATKLAGHLSAALGQPAVLGKLLAGIVLGPAVLGWVQDSSFMSQFAEIGVLLLMFIAGLETDLDQLRKNLKPAFAVAVGGIILPLLGGFAVGELFGLTTGQSWFLGALFSATSVSISVQVLKEMKQLHTKEAATILGAAVLDDVLVVILLAVLISVLGTGGDVALVPLIGKKVVFFAGVLLAGWLVVPRVLGWLAKLRVTEPVMAAALIICFLFAYAGELLGIAGIIGAFAAGLAISQTPFKDAIQHKVEPIAYAVFVPVFFVSIGLHVSFQGVGSQLGLLIVLSIVAVITKLLGGAMGARLTGFQSRSALVIGAGMISRGEVALIIAATGLQTGLLLPEYFTTVIMAVIVTTLVSPPMLKMMYKGSNQPGT
ncbi:cation:proton antiporter [Paenibacillaceae bacterium]|nr:cation:proton antiporter [Paenibacillaceae bacterium]